MLIPHVSVGDFVEWHSFECVHISFIKMRICYITYLPSKIAKIIFVRIILILNVKRKVKKVSQAL